MLVLQFTKYVDGNQLSMLSLSFGFVLRNTEKDKIRTSSHLLVVSMGQLFTEHARHSSPSIDFNTCFSDETYHSIQPYV